MSDENSIKVIEDEEGRKIVVIPQIIFKGKRTISKHKKRNEQAIVDI